MVNKLKLMLLIVIIQNTNSAQKLDAVDIFKQVTPSIVKIIAFDFIDQESKYGTGVVIDSTGVVVTNYHVYSGGKKLEVEYRGKRYKDITIIGADPYSDLMKIIVQGLQAPPIKISDLSDVEIGQKCFAIGNPEDFDNTITDGIISGKRSKNGIKQYQVTAGMTHGSSGGALVNSSAELIGITTAIADFPGINVNFAVSVEYLDKMILSCNQGDSTCIKKIYAFVIADSYITFSHNLKRYSTFLDYRSYLLKTYEFIDSFLEYDFENDFKFRVLLYFYKRLYTKYEQEGLVQRFVRHIKDFEKISPGKSDFIQAMVSFADKKYIQSYMSFTEALNKEYSISEDGKKIFENPYYFYFYAIACWEQQYHAAGIKFMHDAVKYGNDYEAKIWLRSRGY